MPSYLQIENISKSYGPKVLFEHIGFNINEGDKIALIAPNGTGKTSLLRILAGKDSSDSGARSYSSRTSASRSLSRSMNMIPNPPCGIRLCGTANSGLRTLILNILLNMSSASAAF